MFRRFIASFVCLTFIVSTCQPVFAQPASPLPVRQAGAGGEFSVSQLPVPGTMVSVSPSFEPALIRGLTVHRDNPFLFDFIVDPGQSKLSGQTLKEESDRMIKYFFASLTIPDKDIWVNLSPYEKDRMVPVTLGETAMGRDLLAQDYMLKQLTASLIYPQKTLGKTFWDAVYSKAKEMYGTTQIPVNTFNKVWIVPQKAGIYEHGQTAFIVEGHLKVMLEEDYFALSKHQRQPGDMTSVVYPSTTHRIAASIIRQIILPEIEREVNEGKNFATLRQIFYAQVLAVWFKRNLKQALLNRVYANKSTVKGIDQNDAATNEAIYHQYLKAYKKGVFNYIQEDVDPVTQETMPRKYFSGGYGSSRDLALISESPSERTLEDARNDIDFAVLAARPEEVNTAMVIHVSKISQLVPQDIESLFKLFASKWKGSPQTMVQHNGLALMFESPFVEIANEPKVVRTSLVFDPSASKLSLIMERKSKPIDKPAMTVKIRYDFTDKQFQTSVDFWANDKLLRNIVPIIIKIPNGGLRAIHLGADKKILLDVVPEIPKAINSSIYPHEAFDIKLAAGTSTTSGEESKAKTAGEIQKPKDAAMKVSKRRFIKNGALALAGIMTGQNAFSQRNVFGPPTPTTSTDPFDQTENRIEILMYDGFARNQDEIIRLFARLFELDKDGLRALSIFQSDFIGMDDTPNTGTYFTYSSGTRLAKALEKSETPSDVKGVALASRIISSSNGLENKLTGLAQRYFTLNRFDQVHLAYFLNKSTTPSITHEIVEQLKNNHPEKPNQDVFAPVSRNDQVRNKNSSINLLNTVLFSVAISPQNRPEVQDYLKDVGKNLLSDIREKFNVINDIQFNNIVAQIQKLRYQQNPGGRKVAALSNFEIDTQQMNWSFLQRALAHEIGHNILFEKGFEGRDTQGMELHEFFAELIGYVFVTDDGGISTDTDWPQLQEVDEHTWGFLQLRAIIDVLIQRKGLPSEYWEPSRLLSFLPQILNDIASNQSPESVVRGIFRSFRYGDDRIFPHEMPSLKKVLWMTKDTETSFNTQYKNQAMTVKLRDRTELPWETAKKIYMEIVDILHHSKEKWEALSVLGEYYLNESGYKRRHQDQYNAAIEVLKGGEIVQADKQVSSEAEAVIRNTFYYNSQLGDLRIHDPLKGGPDNYAISQLLRDQPQEKSAAMTVKGEKYELYQIAQKINREITRILVMYRIKKQRAIKKERQRRRDEIPIVFQEPYMRIFYNGKMILISAVSHVEGKEGSVLLGYLIEKGIVPQAEVILEKQGNDFFVKGPAVKSAAMVASKEKVVRQSLLTTLKRAMSIEPLENEVSRVSINITPEVITACREFLSVNDPKAQLSDEQLSPNEIANLQARLSNMVGSPIIIGSNGQSLSFETTLSASEIKQMFDSKSKNSITTGTSTLLWSILFAVFATYRAINHRGFIIPVLLAVICAIFAGRFYIKSNRRPDLQFIKDNVEVIPTGADGKEGSIIILSQLQKRRIKENRWETMMGTLIEELNFSGHNEYDVATRNSDSLVIRTNVSKVLIDKRITDMAMGIDKAALANAPGITRGGIDLSQQDSAIHITKDANGGVEVDVDPALIARIERDGMSEVDPVIIGMQPADIQTLFGVKSF